MNKRYLVDTDVLVDYLRGNTKVIDFIDKFEYPMFISSMSVATAKTHNLILITFNTRHFPMFSEILVPYKK